jgi:predicted ATP-grasp superfamily ATP-dependent carboligase
MGRPEAVVLGGLINGLSVVRSLAWAGIHPVLVSNERDLATRSRYVRRHLVPNYDETLIEELMRLREGMPNGAVLICAQDAPLLAVSKFRDRLAPHFGLQELPPHERLVELGRKDRFFQMAQEGGLPVPSTLLLRKSSDLGAINDLRTPLCVKQNGHSQPYERTFKKAYRVETHAEAQALCERILDVTGEVLVQEWIEGTNDSIYFSLCYMGEPKPVAFTGRKGRSWPPQIGVTASCWAAPEVAEELEDLTIRYFRHVGFTNGFASMEFKRDQRDGRFLMVEPTVGRTNGQIEISALCGVNLCYVAYCDLGGLPRPPLRLDPTHVWRDEFTDALAARILGTDCSYPAGHQVHNAFWRWDDPLPALAAASNFAGRGLRRLQRAVGGLRLMNSAPSYQKIS